MDRRLDRLDIWFPAYTTCGALIGLIIAALLSGVHAVVLVLTLAALAVGPQLVVAARFAIERNNEWRRIRAYHRRTNAPRRSVADLASGHKPKEHHEVSLLWALPAAVAVLAAGSAIGAGPNGDRILLAGSFGAATGMILVWIATSTRRRVNREPRTAGVAHWYPAHTTVPSIADIGLLVLADATLTVDPVASAFVVTANLIVISIGLGSAPCSSATSPCEARSCCRATPLRYGASAPRSAAPSRGYGDSSAGPGPSHVSPWPRRACSWPTPTTPSPKWRSSHSCSAQCWPPC